MSSPRLKLEDLVVAYGQSTIIRGINLEVPENELVCLMGRNGVGKTTTLKTIVGLLRPESGVITMDGRQLDRLPTSERARSGIAYVPQGRDIFPAGFGGEGSDRGNPENHSPSGHGKGDRGYTLAWAKAMA